MTDYRTLLADAMWHMGSAGTEADAALATRIPDLCPDCKGSGWAGCSIHTAENGWEPHRHHCQSPCTHPNAPTIADLLQWGENVAKTKERPDRESCVEFNGYLYGDTPDLLAALRGEGQ